uniref:Bifunctional inhibitor/plant lipid transfer protein/seed storage helical domain-containing protein n=1 Tax=Leersia perrieri TaxID=77586 RepID=A0A0D9V0F3_9ORYZ
MATKQARNHALFFSTILLILVSVKGNRLPNTHLAPIESPTPTPAPQPSSSPPPTVTPAPAPTSLPKCPLVLADLNACVTLGLGNNLISPDMQKCCPQVSKLGRSTAATCLCEAMKADIRVGVNISISSIIAQILNLCGQATTEAVVCIR